MFGMCVVNFENHCRVEGGEVWLKFGQWKERTIGIGGICRLEPSVDPLCLFSSKALPYLLLFNFVAV